MLVRVVEHPTGETLVRWLAAIGRPPPRHRHSPDKKFWVEARMVDSGILPESVCQDSRFHDYVIDYIEWLEGEGGGT